MKDTKYLIVVQSVMNVDEGRKIVNKIIEPLNGVLSMDIRDKITYDTSDGTHEFRIIPFHVLENATRAYRPDVVWCDTRAPITVIEALVPIAGGLEKIQTFGF